MIGASQDPRKVGYAVLSNLRSFGYRGKVFPVNPKAGEVLGLQTRKSVLEIGEEIDLAVIAIPAAFVPESLRECADRGVKTAVVISAGFKESGAEGIRLEEEVRAVSRDRGIRILGPNCLGVINTANGLNATFSAGMLPKGRLAFFSQSGALGIAILDWAIGNRVGFSKFISLGNKADLNETDFIDYFVNDPQTDVILGYIEDVVEGGRFLEVARRATKTKPVILVKAGSTQAGARAASSHTGALAGSERAFQAAFAQTGIMRAEGIEDLFETAMAFNAGRIPGGKRLLIVTNAGGPGIIAADAAERLSIDLPQLSRASVESLRATLPRNASLYNPVDIIGDATAERYETVLETVLPDPNADGILVILTPQAMTDPDKTAGTVIAASRKTGKPIITSFMGEERVRASIERLRAAAIPNFPYPEPAVKAFRRLSDYSRWIRKETQQPIGVDADREKVSRMIGDALAAKKFQFAEDDAREILFSYGFRFPKKRLVQTSAEAAAAAAKIGFPVVMKVSSPDILHKTDIGGVRLGIRTAREARDAFTEITLNARRFTPSAFINGVSVYEMLPKGKEVILGITLDRTFGHLVMFGLGGIYVEVLKDVSFRIVPITPSDAREMVTEIRAFPLLEGVRGEAPADLDAIVDSLARLSALATDFPIIQELDINPLVVYEKGAVALDARIIIHGNPQG